MAIKKIASAVKKGGTGKTSTSTAIAHGLSLEGKRVALVDCDAQGNASTNFLTDDMEVEYELADYLVGKCSVKDLLYKVRDNLFLCPTFAIGGDLPDFIENKAKNGRFELKDLITELESMEFDYVIFDLSPSFGDWEKFIIESIEDGEVITPVLPEFFSLDGIEIFREDLEELKKQRRLNTVYKKVIVNNFNKSLSVHTETLADIKKAVDGVLDVFVIPQDTKIKEAQNAQQTVLEYKGGKSRSVEAYRELARAF